MIFAISFLIFIAVATGISIYCFDIASDESIPEDKKSVYELIGIVSFLSIIIITVLIVIFKY